MSNPDPTPIPPDAPAFNPVDPISITWYVTAIVTVLGFVLKKDLTSYAGPVSMGLFAAVGIAMGIIRAVKHRTYNVALQQYNQLRLDHFATLRNDGRSRLDMRVQMPEPPEPPPAKKTTARRTQR